MMQRVSVVTALLLTAAVPSAAGRLTIGSTVSLHHSNGKTRVMLGVAANYRLSPRWSLRGQVDGSKWNGYYYVPVSASLLGHIAPRGPLDPYLGGGLNTTFWPGHDDSPDPTVGYHAIAGVRLRLGGKLSAHVEGRYLVDDASAGDGSWTWGTGASGALRWTF